MPYKIIGLTDRRTGQKLYTLHNSVAWGIIKELVLDQFFFVCKLCLEVDFLLYRFVWIGFHWYHCIYTFIFLIIQTKTVRWQRVLLIYWVKFAYLLAPSDTRRNKYQTWEGVFTWWHARVYRLTFFRGTCYRKQNIKLKKQTKQTKHNGLVNEKKKTNDLKRNKWNKTLKCRN